MDPEDLMGGFRDAAQDQIASNAVTLGQAPATEAGDQDPSAMDAGHAALDSVEGAMEGVKPGLPAAANAVDRAARIAGGFAAKAPGRVLSLVDILTAKDKARAAAGVGGGEVGGTIGGFVPGAEPLTVPLGAFIGNQATKFVYDHGADLANAPARLGHMFQKGVQMFGHGFDRGLPPYYTPMN